MLASALTTIALLPGVLTGTVNEVKEQTPLPILISDNFYSDFDELFPFGAAIAAATRSGPTPARIERRQRLLRRRIPRREGRKPFGRRKVTLTKGRKGRYQPLSCGGSCSPPSISWKERGVTYTIQAKVVGDKTDRQCW